MPLTRLVFAGFVLTMALVLVLRIAATLLGPTAASATAAEDMAATSAATAAAVEAAAQAPAALPTARLRIRAVEDTRLRTAVDGVSSFKGTLPAREIIDLQGNERIEVWADNLTNILITYNGERIEPLGKLSEGRKLVFIQD